MVERGKQRFATKNGDHDFGDVRAFVPSRIAGIVVDEAGKPIEGVRVGADTSGLGFGLRSETKTDAAGAFEVGALHAGGWKLRTLSPNYLPATLDVALAEEEQKRDVTLRLARGNAIAGQVLDDRGVGVAGQEVRCVRRRNANGHASHGLPEQDAGTPALNDGIHKSGLAGARRGAGCLGRGDIRHGQERNRPGQSGDLSAHLARRAAHILPFCAKTRSHGCLH